MKKRIYILLFIYLGCVFHLYAFDNNDKMAILENMPSYLQTGNSAISKELRTYLDNFYLPYEKTTYRYGFISTDYGHLFVQSFQPKKPKAVVAVSHGYLEHSAWTFQLTNFLINENYIVVLYDHYGHGFSDGTPGHIDEFTQYGYGFSKVIDTVYPLWKDLPFVAIGHSLGGATIIQYTLSQKHSPLKGIVLAAPLVRSYLWGPSAAAVNIFDSVVNRIPRRFSYRKELIDKGKNDPLQTKTMPLTWMEALVEWDSWNDTYPTTDIPTLLLQGAKDTVVDSEYNYSWIKKHYTDLKYQRYEDADHLLFLESDELQEQIFIDIKHFLNDLLEE
ncbi:alpha/beta fold hydrolase [Spirochaeta cellobiosiphila]|uniref:alpha/beta fold hydrolase n=1 Tax=Spirochaeta cellobiosiphila TaxID=504483 RepID=UPI000419EF37|nr:alpha/beta fold hydrolase [Spirochaeta cellobiosiphila]